MTALEWFDRALGDDIIRVSPRLGPLAYPGEVVLDLGERGGRHLPRGRLRGRSEAGFGDVSRFDDDRAWHDALLFHECFRGDSGVGLGASHQTGSSGLVADLVVRLSRARDSRASS